MAAPSRLQMFRAMEARQVALTEAARRRSVKAGKVLFCVMVSPVIAATIAALWATYGTL